MVANFVKSKKDIIQLKRISQSVSKGILTKYMISQKVKLNCMKVIGDQNMIRIRLNFAKRKEVFAKEDGNLEQNLVK